MSNAGYVLMIPNGIDVGGDILSIPMYYCGSPLPWGFNKDMAIRFVRIDDAKRILNKLPDNKLGIIEIVKYD